ncbi:MAG TPA: DUF427 domain-containing protein [Candidatus Tumulicola sp.]|nr:DUF427 domain-containing protein [Candidatus Tumulicola sp.]
MAAEGVKVQKEPSPDHPIAIEPTPGRVVVRMNGRVIADSNAGLELCEADYPAVQYVPRKDVNMSLLERSTHVTYCPYKGDCSYFDIVIGGLRSKNAVWTYENPFPAVAAIRGHLAFYPERVDSVETDDT